MQDNAIGRILGDLFTAQSQLFVRDSAYENLGRLRLGFTDQAPLGQLPPRHGLLIGTWHCAHTQIFCQKPA